VRQHSASTLEKDTGGSVVVTAWLHSLNDAGSISSFYLTADHRDLHSFPTRRSSDLNGGEISAIASGSGDAGDINLFCKNLQIVNDGEISRLNSSNVDGSYVDAVVVNQLEIRNGGAIAAGVSGTGNGGNVAVVCENLQ